MQVQSQFIEMFGNQNTNDKNWDTSLIKDEFTLSMGKTPARTQPEYWTNKGYKWISIADMAGYSKYTAETAEQITKKAITECGIKAVEPNTVIMSFKLSIGRTAITSERVYTNEAIMAFDGYDTDNFNLDFIYYAFSKKNWLMDAKQAVKGATLNKGSIGKSSIIIPPLDLQNRFAAILQQADKSKFVGFKSQFIEMFGKSKTNRKISDVAIVVSGKSIPKNLEDIEGDFAYIKVADFNLPVNNKNIVASSRYVTQDNARTSKCIPIGSTIFAKNGAAAMSNKKRITKVECCIDMNTMAVIPNQSIIPEFLYSVFESVDLSAFTRQGAVPSMSPHSVKNMELYLPDIEEQQMFVSIAEQADKSKLIELSNKCYHKIYSIPTIQKKLLENGSPKATIETDESRSYFLIDIPCRKDFVQDDSILRQIDIHRVTINLMTKCPRYVQDMSKIEVEHLSVCILKSRTAVSAQIMLEGVDKVSYKQKRRKYLDKLLEMGVLLMTIPEKPTSRNQQYILSEYGKGLLE